MRTRFAFAILLAAWLSACGSSSNDNTMIVVAVWSDLPVPTELDSIRIEVKGSKLGGGTYKVASRPGDTGPLVKAELVPGGNKNLNFLVTATGVGKGRDLVSQSARVSFVSGKARLLKLVLGSACKGQTCSATYTCRDGLCNQPIVVNELPPYDPNEPLTAPDAGIVEDSGMVDVDSSTDGTGAQDSSRRDAVAMDVGVDQGVDAPIVVEGTGGVSGTGGMPGTGGVSGSGGGAAGGVSGSGSGGIATVDARGLDAAVYDSGEDSDVPQGQDAVVGTGGNVGSGGVGGAIGSGGIGGSGGTAGTGGVTGSGGSTAACRDNATRCSNNTVQTCANGQYGAGVACGIRQTCNGPEGSAKCECKEDPVCTTLGDTCASPTKLAKCAQDERGCYYQMTVDTCSSGPCSGTAGEAACCTGQCAPADAAADVASHCGNGLVESGEQCDDGDLVSGNGCSSTCQIEPGYACPPPSTACHPTVCGDGFREGTEGCDDGNTRPFDGCSPTCAAEPRCGYPNNDSGQPYQCFSVCGDGLKMPGEACDDGNVRDGDGCSSSCTVEAGYTCTASSATLGSSLTIPVMYRDFNWKHPQFEVDPVYDQRQVGIVNSAIGVNGKPVYNSSYVGNNAGASLSRPWTMDGPAFSTTSPLMSDASGATFRGKVSNNTASLNATNIADDYAQWYTDDPNATGNPVVDAANSAVLRISIPSTLTFSLVGTGIYQYYSAAFFPIDGLGFGNINYPATNPTHIHNYSFTSEAHYWFQYQGGEQLNFRGDDDVWVFINGRLAIDLGGIHSELRGTALLNGPSTQVCVDEKPVTCAEPATCPAPTSCATVSSGFGMVVGNIYAIAIFQAERRVPKSSFQLTLSGFNAPKSVCSR